MIPEHRTIIREWLLRVFDSAVRQHHKQTSRAEREGDESAEAMLTWTRYKCGMLKELLSMLDVGPSKHRRRVEGGNL